MLVYSRTVRACFQHAACLAAPESEAVASAVPVAELLNNLGEQTIAWKPQQSTATSKKHGVQGFGGCLNATLLVPASPGWGLIVGGCGCSEPSGIDRLADTSCRTDQVTESRVHTARLSLRLRVCYYCVSRGAHGQHCLVLAAAAQSRLVAASVPNSEVESRDILGARTSAEDKQGVCPYRGLCGAKAAARRQGRARREAQTHSSHRF